MPRDGAIIFSDLIGKLDQIRVACDKCGRYPTMHGALLRRINDPNSVLNANPLPLAAWSFIGHSIVAKSNKRIQASPLAVNRAVVNWVFGCVQASGCKVTPVI